MKAAEPVILGRGPAWPNRIALAPLTNTQSHADGTASSWDRDWFRLVSAGGYGMVMTCAAHVQRNGQAFPGQLGIYDAKHIPGLAQIAAIIRDAGAVSSVQLFHGGARSLGGDLGTPVAPTAHRLDVHELSTGEVEQLGADFVRAAQRAHVAGFDGVELHGAFGWLLTQFLSPELNLRKDRYGGDLEGRSRLIFEILGGIRSATDDEFQVGLRLSMGRYGMRLSELTRLSEDLMLAGLVDYLDLAPWDVAALSSESGYVGRTIVSAFTELDRGNAVIGASGRLHTAQQARALLEAGCDFAMIGRLAVAEPGFARRLLDDPEHTAVTLPVSTQFLERTGISPPMIEHMGQYRGFLTER
jgi:2,4-dienoyl-CoA reductase-like NADH-dependent reductase (Old Yellow Enzyme family)